MAAKQPLPRWRFRWLTVPCHGRSTEADRHASAFAAMREECGLSLGDVARGWGVSVVEVSELERGLRRFPESADLWAALQQLWCWKAERR